jgi:hypothetical protein
MPEEQCLVQAPVGASDATEASEKKHNQQCQREKRRDRSDNDHVRVTITLKTW